MGRHRATRSSEKEARRGQILDAAAALLETWSFSDVTMDRIAEKTGIAKGTLYLYFGTKEAIFLALFEEQVDGWYSQLRAGAESGAGSVTPSDAARFMAATLVANQTLVHLHGLLHSTLGHNVDFDVLLGFRRRHMQRIAGLAPALARRVDGLSETTAIRFLVRLEAVVGGLMWASSPPPPLRRAFAEPGLEMFHIDFAHELTEVFAALLTWKG